MSNGISDILKAAKFVPASVVVKLLGKVNPKFKNYFTSVASYGLDVNRAVDYLADRFTNPANNEYKQQLDKGAAQNTLRPDEKAARQQISQSEIPGKAARSLASFAGAGILGGLDQDRSEEQAPDSRMLQTQQESPEIQQAASSQNSAQSMEKSIPADASQGFMQKYPELGMYVDKLVRSGMDPQEAAGHAKQDKRFMPMVRDIEGNMGQDFLDIISQIYQGYGKKKTSPAANGNSQLMQLIQAYNSRNKT